MYAMVCCRTDTASTMNVISMFMSNPEKAHWEFVNWTIKYVRGSYGRGLKFQRIHSDTEALVGFVDADFVANILPVMCLLCL